MPDPDSQLSFSGRTEYRTDDAELQQVVEAAFERSRIDSRWFAITTVLLTPVAILLAVGVLIVTVQWFGTGGGWYRPRSGFVGLSVANIVVGYLVLRTARGHWRSRWVQGGVGAFVAMLLLTFGSGLDAASLVFLVPWTLLALVSLILISQAHEDTAEASSTVVTALPNLILGSYRDIVQDLLSRSRGGHDVERAIAMLQAVHTRDEARQRQLLLAASRAGIELRRELVRAKLVREYRGQLRLGASAPPLRDSKRVK